MKNIIFALFIIMIPLNAIADAGCVSTKLGIICSVKRGENLVSFDSDTASSPTIKQCDTPNSNQSTNVGECRVVCPKGSSICIVQCTSEYEETESGQLVRVKNSDSEATNMYTDSSCTELWNPDDKKYHTFTKDNEIYSLPIFCKKNTKEILRGINNNFVIMHITVFY